MISPKATLTTTSAGVGADGGWHATCFALRAATSGENRELKMNYYINFDTLAGVSINTFRKPEGYAHSDVRGLVEDIRAGRPGCCDLQAAKAALEDGSLWSDDDQEALELLHGAIRDFENDDFESDGE